MGLSEGVGGTFFIYLFFNYLMYKVGSETYLYNNSTEELKRILGNFYSAANM